MILLLPPSVGVSRSRYSPSGKLTNAHSEKIGSSCSALSLGYLQLVMRLPSALSKDIVRVLASGMRSFSSGMGVASTVYQSIRGTTFVSPRHNPLHTLAVSSSCSATLRQKGRPSTSGSSSGPESGQPTSRQMKASAQQSSKKRHASSHQQSLVKLPQLPSHEPVPVV